MLFCMRWFKNSIPCFTFTWLVIFLSTTLYPNSLKLYPIIFFYSTKTGWVPAVCGPALYYYNNDFSWRLVEWLELLRAQGFGQVFLYNSGVHPNITKVLQYYTDEGFIEVTDYTYPPPYVNEPSIRRWVATEVVYSIVYWNPSTFPFHSSLISLKYCNITWNRRQRYHTILYAGSSMASLKPCR